MWLGVGLIGLFLVLALVFFMGHGGCLIAGYNTASPEEKARYDFVNYLVIWGSFL